MNQDMNIIKIFWTGGWDSTFRLLQALLIEGMTVQPYYLIDSGRKSLEIEKRTIVKIKKEVLTKYDIGDRLLETFYFNVRDIRPEKNITASYSRLKERQRLGIQYDWLARFCYQEGLIGVELCIEKGAGSQIDQVLMINFKEGSPELSDTMRHLDEYIVFKYFRFPLIYSTKLDMKIIAEKNGFLDLMNLTWFCHTPRNGRPCGLCQPCQITTCDGLGYRIPMAGHIRRKYRQTFFHIKEVLRKFPRSYQFLKKARNIFN